VTAGGSFQYKKGGNNKNNCLNEVTPEIIISNEEPE
jgi:hypothetical protein